MTRGQQVAHPTNLRELKGATARSIPVIALPALNAARAVSLAGNVEKKTYLEEAAVLSHLADIHRHGVSGFPDASATCSGDQGGTGANHASRQEEKQIQRG